MDRHLCCATQTRYIQHKKRYWCEQSQSQLQTTRCGSTTLVLVDHNRDFGSLLIQHKSTWLGFESIFSSVHSQPRCTTNAHVGGEQQQKQQPGSDSLGASSSAPSFHRRQSYKATSILNRFTHQSMDTQNLGDGDRDSLNIMQKIGDCSVPELPSPSSSRADPLESDQSSTSCEKS